MAYNVTGTPFWTYETTAITGIACKTYDADCSSTQSQGTNFQGRNINNYSDNQETMYSVQGEITGSSPGGICLSKLGFNLASPPSFLWTNNMSEAGSSLVCQSAKASLKAGSAAEFSLTARKAQYY